MDRNRRTIIAVCCSVSLVGILHGLAGCGKSFTPVDEVSLEASGVQIQDREFAVDSQTDWPTWRGPNYNGHALTAAAPTEWDEDKNVLWKADVPGRGHSSPIVVGDQVLLTTAIDDQQKQLVISYDRVTGSKRWEKVLHEGGFPAKREIHQKASNANNSLATDGKYCYAAFFNSGKITATALDLEGNPVWQQELGSFSSKFGFAPSPILYKSLVIFTADNWGGGYLAALDAETGEVAWRIARPAKNSHSTPLLAEVGGQMQLILSGCDLVASFDPGSGEGLWSVSATSETTCGTMVALGDKVYASGGYPENQTVCISATGDKVWENRTRVYEPSMLAANDHLFAVSDDGIAYCWSGEDGTERWKKRLGGNFSSSPVLCGDLIYVSNLAGKTFIFKANADGYEQVAANSLGSDCYASPAIVGTEIFTRVGVLESGQRAERLVCISSATAD